MKVLKLAVLALALLGLGTISSAQGGSQTLTSSDRLVASYYFYWYDIYSGMHIVDPDGSDALTHHLPDEFLSDFSYKEISWHRRELLDMMEAGIDVVLPVYWGNDHNKFWSIEGLKKLVEAEQQLIAEGERPPKIGMFFDTTALYQQNHHRPLDLTSTYGKTIFYQMIKDFYSIVPRELWAQIDERPIIWLYTSAPWISAYDQGAFNFLKERFQADFGQTPYVVREASWSQVVTENKYKWGAALLGASMASGVGSISPGYDDSAVYGRVPRIRDRRGGQFYNESWEAALHSGRKIIVIETWNELHEGTEICHTKEFGRQYIGLTTHYVRRFKSTPTVDYSSVSNVWVDLGASPRSTGLEVSINEPDGAWKPAQVGGIEAVYTDNSTDPPSYYIYFDIYDDFLYAQASGVWVQVEYLDQGFDSWRLEYDSANPQGGPFEGAYTPTPVVQLRNTGQWKVQTFYLPDALFAGRQNFGSDFRLFDMTDGPNYFNRVWVSKVRP